MLRGAKRVLATEVSPDAMRSVAGLFAFGASRARPLNGAVDPLPCAAVRVLDHVLVRAPLLPVAALGDPAERLRAAALGPAAVRIGSPTLHEHADGRAAAAWRRYGKRAAFRATPHGLWAGVAMARVEKGASDVALADPAAHLSVRWDRVAALGRARLATDEGWRTASLRRSPSMLRLDDEVAWIAFGEGAQARPLRAELDEALTLVFAASEQWTAAVSLARRLARKVGSLDDARTFLLELVDDGFLHHDLEPPLVGSAPDEWAAQRYRDSLPLPGVWLGDDRVGEHIENHAAAWRALPGAEHGDATLATLLHRSTAPLRIAREPLERAAACAPLLFALAEALHPPLAESAVAIGMDAVFAAASALVGEGLLPLSQICFGRYGVGPEEGGGEPPRPHAGLVAWLTSAVIEAARAGREELRLDEDALRVHLATSPTPATFELHVQPCLPPEGGVEGEDWLLGLHGPAGASWGRFHHALGAPMREALEVLAEAEREIDREALRVDVAYAPSRELADLCQVPSLRAAAFALTSWPDTGVVRAQDCAIANEPAGPAHRGLSVAGHALVVSPLHRVRSTTAAPSVWASALGDTLLRQHAPWAFGWGPLRDAPWLPRVRVREFVVAPQSWALPADLSDASLRAWRQGQRVPRWIQVGTEDLLLPLDLEDEHDRASLRDLPPAERTRAHEIWPPLGREMDRSGRRIELVSAVVDDPPSARRRNERLAVMAVADSPSRQVRRVGWRTVKLYAAAERHERLLLRFVAPWLRGEPALRQWFFLPYADESGLRDHLRLRLRAKSEADADSLMGRLQEALVEAMSVGDLVALEIGAYRPESARYGASLSSVEKIFQSDSQLVLDVYAQAALAPECALVAGFHALASGLGLSRDERARVAASALSAYALDDAQVREQLAPAYRALQRDLLAQLEKPGAPFLAHARRVSRVRLPRRSAVALLPTLLHLASVRMCGVDRECELRALYLWTRAQESLRAKRKR